MELPYSWGWLPAAAALGWLLILLLPWRPWSTRERLETGFSKKPENLESPEPPPELPTVADLSTATPLTTEPIALRQVTALVPARNEAAFVRRTLRALAAQATQGQEALRILLIDDQSTDGTQAQIRDLPGVKVIDGSPPPPGWSGKLWALAQGCQEADTPYLLFLDADIEMAPGLLNRLLEKATDEDLDFISLMARLPMRGFWERLCMPAFIYFFKLLYPFALANQAGHRVAAAAGGCILLRAELLRRIGGLDRIRGELIDDCALARACKQAGGRTWIGLTRAATSLRTYPDLGSIWSMVSRTAFAQLRHSLPLLALCSLLLLLAFVVPVLSLIGGTAVERSYAGIALVLMASGYLPLLCYYRLPAWWALALPLAGTLFLLMTLDSARRQILGAGVAWKGRYYRVDP